jgi:hypothetical protein
MILKILIKKRCTKKEISKLNNQEKDWFSALKEILPKSLAGKVVDIAHQEHQGIVKTKALLREKVWFPLIDKEVERKISNCIPCQACSKKNNPESLKTSNLPAEPWTLSV